MLIYNLVERPNPLRPEEAKKLYLSLKSLKLIRIDEITKRITEKINIQEDLCRSVLNTWNKVAIELLTTGHSVELGDAGYVYLRASSHGATNEEEASARMVKNIRGHVTFSKKTKAAFNEAERINAKHLISGINAKEQTESTQEEE